MTTRTVTATVLVGQTRHVVQTEVDVDLLDLDLGYGEGAYGTAPYGDDRDAD